MKDLTPNDIIGVGKKKVFKNMRFSFKCEAFSVDTDAKYERLDPKKIMPFEEYEADKTGKRVIRKLIGYNRGEAQYFQALQDDKGKWIADMDKSVSPEGIEKVILDTRTGEVKQKDTNKGLWFIKTAPAAILSEWLVEETYNLWTEDNPDNMLKVYQYLADKGLVGVMKFNPNGTAFNAFLIPQRIDGGRFRLLLQVARVKTNKPEISPTMTITNAEARAREKVRIESIGLSCALEEV